MRILFSVSYAMNLKIAPGPYGGHEVSVLARSSDWGKQGLKKYPHYAREALRLIRKARGYDALALFTAGMEAFFIGTLRRFLPGNTRLVCADFLIPRKSPLLAPVSAGLRQIDAFVCIRKGDMETLQRRFRIPPSRCSFAHFPCDCAAMSHPTTEAGYIYSAGWAHRDWPLLLRALTQVECPAILSACGDLKPTSGMASRVRILPQRSPAEGQRLMADASMVVLPMAETELPSGPLVLLDAMAMGKALIVTDVNGSRDYVTHGKTGWVVPPGDDKALAHAIQELTQNSPLRRQIGQAAREEALRRFTTGAFIEKTLAACATTAESR